MSDISKEAVILTEDDVPGAKKQSMLYKSFFPPLSFFSNCRKNKFMLGLTFVNNFLCLNYKIQSVSFSHIFSIS